MAISNNEIKKVKSLQQKKFRDEYGLFIAEGEKMVKEAMSSGFTVEKVYHKSEIGDDAMGRISSLSSPSPALAVVRKPSDVFIEDPAALQDIFSTGGLYLALDGIRDPGNLGTMIRTGEGAGIAGVIMSSQTVDIYNPKVIRSTMGSVYRVPFCYVDDLPATLRLLRKRGVHTYAAHLEGDRYYDECFFAGQTALLIGNEGNGLTDEVTNLAEHKLKIPMEGQVESLNAAISASILMYEAFRQKRGRH